MNDDERDAIDHLFTALAKADMDLEGIIPVWDRSKPGLVMFNCSDLFYWACADGERYEPGDEDLLDSVLEDLAAVDRVSNVYWMELFCCRKRQMRPQYPFFRTYDRDERSYTTDRLTPACRALFDACGPEGSDRDRD